VKINIISIAKFPDLILSKFYLKLFKEKNSLMVFLFHGLFKNEEEKALNIVDPQPWITIDQFNQFINYFINNNYNFISPNDILQGLDKNNKYIMITFDDGYYNNISTLPILKKYKIPALFFPSTNHIKNKKCFWWDVLYRERFKTGKTLKEIIREQNKLKLKTNEEIEKYLIKLFGKKSLKPIGNIDRPFTLFELVNFSKEKYVFIGNHTSNHAILTNYSKEEINNQIMNAQDEILKITGKNPTAISYPNGNYSDNIIEISKENGIKLGFTVDYKKNLLPLNKNSKNLMHLGRFVLSGEQNIIKQCNLFRSDILLYAHIWNLLRKK